MQQEYLSLPTLGITLPGQVVPIERVGDEVFGSGDAFLAVQAGSRLGTRNAFKFCNLTLLQDAFFLVILKATESCAQRCTA